MSSNTAGDTVSLVTGHLQFLLSHPTSLQCYDVTKDFFGLPGSSFTSLYRYHVNAFWYSAIVYSVHMLQPL